MCLCSKVNKIYANNGAAKSNFKSNLKEKSDYPLGMAKLKPVKTVKYKRYY